VLLRFEVSNHRSIKEPVELSMMAVDADRDAARQLDPLGRSVLTTAGIYGANASGKSNIINALGWLSGAVRESLRIWERAVPTQPFRFDGWLAKPTTFEVDLALDGVRHTYALQLDADQVIFEALYSYPKNHRRSLFEREGDALTLRRGLGGIAGVRELLTPTTLVLSAARRFDEPAVLPFAEALSRIRWLDPRASWGPGDPDHADVWLDDLLSGQRANPHQGVLFDVADFADLRSARSLLRFADLGIEDVVLVREPTSRPGREHRRFQFIHTVAGERQNFELWDESEGTQTWFRLIAPVLFALGQGEVLLFDEIDASLHPRLSARLLELFQDPQTNPRGAQLIFTTHDTSLLNHLNRDEVWLTEKGEDGATTLTALAEYGGDKVRRSLNLERAYLQGRFGAVPELDQHLLRQAVGAVDVVER
jgi:energy-coupling factor transporter ATP-binding protein EcfA2